MDIAALGLKLWDEESRSLVSFRALDEARVTPAPVPS
jgi:hypothetical protein